MRHSETVWVATARAAKERCLDLILIQEPPHRSTWERCEWEGYRLVTAKAEASHALIMIRDTLPYTQCQFPGARVCGVRVTYRGTPLVIISAYIRHTTGDGTDQLSRALALASAMSPLVYTGLDANGHSPLWGPPGTRVDRVGEMVEGALSEGNLLVLNSQSSPPTFCSDSGHTSWIDVSAATPALIPSIVGWSVWDSVEVFSDHKLIVTELFDQPRKAEVRLVRDWASVDWIRFGQHLLSALDRSILDRELLAPVELDASVESITDSIQQVIVEVVPVKRICQFSRAGWTPQLTSL